MLQHTPLRSRMAPAEPGAGRAEPKGFLWLHVVPGWYRAHQKTIDALQHYDIRRSPQLIYHRFDSAILDENKYEVLSSLLTSICTSMGERNEASLRLALQYMESTFDVFLPQNEKSFKENFIMELLSTLFRIGKVHSGPLHVVTTVWPRAGTVGIDVPPEDRIWSEMMGVNAAIVNEDVNAYLPHNVPLHRNLNSHFTLGTDTKLARFLSSNISLLCAACQNMLLYLNRSALVVKATEVDMETAASQGCHLCFMILQKLAPARQLDLRKSNRLPKRSATICGWGQNQPCMAIRLYQDDVPKDPSTIPALDFLLLQARQLKLCPQRPGTSNGAR